MEKPNVALKKGALVAITGAQVALESLDLLGPLPSAISRELWSAVVK